MGIGEQVVKFSMLLDVACDERASRDDLEALRARKLQGSLRKRRAYPVPCQLRRDFGVQQRHDAGREAIGDERAFAIDVHFVALLRAVIANAIRHRRTPFLDFIGPCVRARHAARPCAAAGGARRD